MPMSRWQRGRQADRASAAATVGIGGRRVNPLVGAGSTGLGADLVQDFPPDCVPIRRGHLHQPIGHLLAD
ncbi:hypothetical protein [Streptomyces sp. NPDC051162]|uniref:hypothetical protein n=1 Tax=Streptomyces sp. NPDC051162 TaxID=3154747 RepID=UPI00343CB0AE